MTTSPRPPTDASPGVGPADLLDRLPARCEVVRGGHRVLAVEPIAELSR